MTFRGFYWSNSRLADWVRGLAGAPQKLPSGTMEQWTKWHEHYKANFPKTYWLTEDGLDAVQNLLNWPSDRIDDLTTYLRNRFISRTHVVYTNLPKGEWHEPADRLMPAMFSLVVELVEVGKAIDQATWGESWNELPWHQRTPLLKPFRWLTRVRSRELGLRRLDWEITLGEPQFDQWGNDMSSPHQAAIAKEIKELYLWWVDVRPARPDPMDVSGLSAFYGSDEGRLHRKSKDTNIRAEYEAALDLSHKLKQQYVAEDEAMMLRIVNQRYALCT